THDGGPGLARDHDRPSAGRMRGRRLYQGRRRDQGHARDRGRPPQGLSVAIYHRAGGIKYLRVLASGAPVRRSQAVSGALCESQRRSHQRDGARDFVSGRRARNQRPCSHHARLHRLLPRRRESKLSPLIRGRHFRGSERSRVGDANSCCDQTGERIMASYGPELIQIMRAVLDEVMTKIPVEQVTPGVKAHMAEVILKAAAAGQTSYDGLLASASNQIQTILSLLT